MNLRQKFAGMVPLLFVGPAILFVLVFLYAPIVFSAVLSLTDWNFINPEARFVGLANYQQIFRDANFFGAVRNTLVYCIVLIPLQILVPLVLAVLLLRVHRPFLANVYKSALFLPTILAYSTAGTAWLWLMDPQNGFLNTLLTVTGLQSSQWFTDPDLSLWCVAFITFWKNFGLNMLLLLAALSGIPKTLLEAAELDGVSPWQRFRTIELPLISPTFFFVAVTTTLHVLDDIVGIIDILTQGGPYGQSSNILYYLYERGLGFFQFGQASATAMIIIAFVFFITWLQFRFFEDRVHYES